MTKHDHGIPGVVFSYPPIGIVDQTEHAAIKLVMAAQADDFFSPHDETIRPCARWSARRPMRAA